MNYLPLALIFLILLSQKKENYKDILNCLSCEDINTILTSVGLEENLSNGISEILPNLLNGKANASDIIKSAIPVAISYFSKRQNEKPPEPSQAEKFDFNQIKDIAGEEIAEKLKCYFE